MRGQTVLNAFLSFVSNLNHQLADVARRMQFACLNIKTPVSFCLSFILILQNNAKCLPNTIKNVCRLSNQKSAGFRNLPSSPKQTRPVLSQTAYFYLSFAEAALFCHKTNLPRFWHIFYFKTKIALLLCCEPTPFIAKRNHPRSDGLLLKDLGVL